MHIVISVVVSRPILTGVTSDLTHAFGPPEGYFKISEVDIFKKQDVLTVIYPTVPKQWRKQYCNVKIIMLLGIS